MLANTWFVTLQFAISINTVKIGNVYVKFAYEEDAEKAVTDLDNRWFLTNHRCNLAFQIQVQWSSNLSRTFAGLGLSRSTLPPTWSNNLL